MTTRWEQSGRDFYSKIDSRLIIPLLLHSYRQTLGVILEKKMIDVIKKCHLQTTFSQTHHFQKLSDT